MQRFQQPYFLKAIPEVQEYLNLAFDNARHHGDLQDLYRRRYNFILLYLRPGSHGEPYPVCWSNQGSQPTIRQRATCKSSSIGAPHGLSPRQPHHRHLHLLWPRTLVSSISSMLLVLLFWVSHAYYFSLSLPPFFVVLIIPLCTRYLESDVYLPTLTSIANVGKTYRGFTTRGYINRRITGIIANVHSIETCLRNFAFSPGGIWSGSTVIGVSPSRPSSSLRNSSRLDRMTKKRTTLNAPLNP